MNRFVKDFGKYFFYLLLASFMVACGGEDENPSPTVTSEFTFAADATAPGKINFTNNSNAGSYLWEFGDGTTSTETSPSHTFPVNGTFQVKLTSFGAGGSGKLPGKSDGSGTGTSSTKAVSVTNAVVQPAMTASMQGSSSFTYTATPSSVAAWRTATSIMLRGVSSTGVIMEFAVPANAVAGGTYAAGTQQPNNNTFITYTNSVSTWNANTNSCGGPATGTIKVNSISAASITGTFSGTIYNITCSGGFYTITNGTFTASF